MNMNNEEKIKLADLMEEVSQKCELDFDGYLLTSKSFKSLINISFAHLKDKIDEVINFVCGDVIDYCNNNLTILIDGFASSSKKMNGKDYREIIARTMTYMACAKVVTTQPLADLSSVVARTDFTYLINQLMSFEEYPTLVEKYSKCNILIISNVNISALNTIVKGKEEGEINELKAMKIRTFFEEVMSRRKTLKRTSIFTIQSKYEILSQYKHLLGNNLDFIIDNLEEKYNVLSKKFISENNHCRIYIPANKSDAEKKGIVRSSEQQIKDFYEFFIQEGASSDVAKKTAFVINQACRDNNIMPEDVFDNLQQDFLRYTSHEKTRGKISELIDFVNKNAYYLVILRSEIKNGL
jgi:hypothetical protein